MNSTKLISKKMIGYRYGKAPESGKSWNYAENQSEPGVSMAQVGCMKEINSMTVADLRESKIKRYYYTGEIAGAGSDANEVCLKNVKKISYKEYLLMKKNEEIKEMSNALVNYFADDCISLIKRGWNLGRNTTIETLEIWRKGNLK